MSQLVAYDSELNQRFNTLNERARNQNDKITQCESRITALTQKLLEFTSSFNQSNQRISRCEHDLTALRTNADGLRNDFTRLEARVTSMEASLDLARQTVSQISSTSDQRFTELRNDLGGLRSRSHDMQHDVETLGGKIGTAEGRINLVGQEMVSFTSRLSINEGTLAAIRQQHGTFERRTNQMEDESNNFRSRLSAIDRDPDCLRVRVERAEGVIETSRRQVSMLRRDLKQVSICCIIL